MLNTVDSQLQTTAKDAFFNLKDHLWAAINDEIQLKECDVFSYNPDLASDPFGEDGCIWSFNYFFYNKKLKRIVFFNCRATRYQLLFHDFAHFVLKNCMLLKNGISGLPVFEENVKVLSWA